MHQTQGNQTWEILADPTSFQGMPRAFNFEPGLVGYKNDPHTADVSEREAFAYMKQALDYQCSQNPHLKAVPLRKTKDVIHKNKVRETYDFDQKTK